MIDGVTDYIEKVRQEHDAVRSEQALVNMIRYRARLRALHEEAYETEMMRDTVFHALRPYLPEPAERQPVALSEAPAGYSNGQTGFDSEAEFFGHEPAAEWADILRRAG